MSIIYKVTSMSSSTATYDDPNGASNYYVLGTMACLRRRSWREWEKAEDEFKTRQKIFEEMLVKKHGAVEVVTLLEESGSGLARESDRELLIFADYFIIIKEAITEYHSDHVNKQVAYCIPKEGWDMSDPLCSVDCIGWITKYGERV